MSHCQVYFVHRYLFRLPFGQLFVRPALAALVVTPVAVVVGLRSPLLGAAIGGIASVLVLAASGYIRREELQPLERALRSGVWMVRRHGS